MASKNASQPGGSKGSQKTPRTYLSLEKKVEVINHLQKHPGTPIRALGEIFGCGKTQIAQIVKNKESILSLFQANVSGSRVHTSKPCTSEYAKVNESLYKWFTLACSKNIYPGGPELVEKAKEIAEKLGKPEFKGSRGWLDKWKKRYNVKQLKICGESGDVQGETVESWKERLPEIVQGYDKEDVWNMDETGIFWRALPDRGFGQKSKSCKGGKKSKQRITVAFFVSASGHKEKPVVIWKSENPRCMQRFNKSCLPVSYYSQTKAWMTGEILEDILRKLNRRLCSTNRNVLLLMDNAGCHPEDLSEKFSNIKICFLPPNTTSTLQPLDLGIIQNFKVHYRRYFLRYVLSKIDECDSASDVVKSVDILVAIRWVALAWSQVTAETVTKCFRNAGVLDRELDVITRGIEEDSDPFLEADERMELEQLIEKTGTGGCTIDEFLTGDSDLPVCAEMDDDNWDTAFLAEIGNEQQMEDNDSDAEDDATVDQEPPLPRLKTYKEAITALEDVSYFLEYKGHGDEALSISSNVDKIVNLKHASARQTTLHDYFSQ